MPCTPFNSYFPKSLANESLSNDFLIRILTRISNLDAKFQVPLPMTANYRKSKKNFNRPRPYPLFVCLVGFFITLITNSSIKSPQVYLEVLHVDFFCKIHIFSIVFKIRSGRFPSIRVMTFVILTPKNTPSCISKANETISNFHKKSTC